MYNPENVVQLLLDNQITIDTIAKVMIKEINITKTKKIFNTELSITSNVNLIYNLNFDKQKTEINYITIYITDTNTNEIIFSEHINKKISITSLINETNIIDKITRSSLRYLKNIFKFEINFYHILYTTYVSIFEEMEKEITSIYSNADLKTYMLIILKEIKTPEDIKKIYVNKILD